MTDYGRDLSCTYRTVNLEYPDGTFRDVTAVQPAIDMLEVSGRPCLAEALVRRLVTYRGTLIDVVIPTTTADYGSQVTQFANADMSPRDIAQAGAVVDAEMLKDERVVGSTTPASFAANLLLLPITITDGAGPFPLVLGISNVTVQVLSAPS